jgi:hypothetical protein
VSAATSSSRAFALTLALTGCAATPIAFAQESAESRPDATEPSLTARMVEQLSAVYADLAALIGDNPADAVGWAQEDIENLGDWEYRIVELDERDDAAIETALNALGDERWEVYWVQEGNGGDRFYLKRPSLSYLNRVPLSSLLRMLPGGEP